MGKSQLRFSEPIYSSEQTILADEDSLPFVLGFIQTASTRPSLLFRSACQSIQASVALLALGQVDQSYFLMAQAFEVSLRGVIDEVFQLGLKAWMARNPVLARQRAGNSTDFDLAMLRCIVKEKHLIETFVEVERFVQFSERGKSAVRTINLTRNEIVHRGGNLQRRPTYLQSMVFDLLPLLDELYFKTMNLDLCDLIFQDVARELIVVARYLKSRTISADDLRSILNPIRAAFFHNRDFAAGTPFNLTPEGKGEDDWAYFDWEQELKRKLSSSARGMLLDDLCTWCVVCGKACFVITDGILREKSGHKYIEATGVTCPYCHLSIPEDWQELARLHYGPIDEKRCGTACWTEIVKFCD